MKMILLLFIGYVFYQVREYFVEVVATICVFLILIYIMIIGSSDPITEKVEPAKTTKTGARYYKYSSPQKYCPWGETYYTVVKKDSFKPSRYDKCINCQQTYSYHGKGRYKDAADFNLSVIADYAASGNN